MTGRVHQQDIRYKGNEGQKIEGVVAYASTPYVFMVGRYRHHPAGRLNQNWRRPRL